MKDRYNYTIFHICHKLHCRTCGSGEYYTSEEQIREDITWLQARVDNWQQEAPSYIQHDLLVRLLALQTIADIEAHLKGE